MPRVTKPEFGLERRLSLRIPHQIKERIAMAAALEGRSLTEYVTDAANYAAIQTLETQRTLEVDERNLRRIFELLENPPVPTLALRRLMARP